ncbi:MAG: hypothetical protein HUK08_07700 [Bacteroidaceae bacterium]|nr:hypothetical protein [Bacteroidaceae bacterium]
MATKNIQIKGLASVMSDYDCTDGELHIAHNCVNGGGGLQAVRETTALQDIDGYFMESGNDFGELLFIHKTSHGDRYLATDDDHFLFHYVGFHGEYSWEQVDGFPQSLVFDEGKYEISAVGDVLVVNYTGGDMAIDGLHYLRYDGEGYRYMGQRPPDIPLEFQMYYDNPKYVSGLGYYYECKATENFDVEDDVDPKKLEDRQKSVILQDALMGLVNSVTADAKEQTKFLNPFFVRVAYRMYDGSLMGMGNPVLMLPNTDIVQPYGSFAPTTTLSANPAMMSGMKGDRTTFASIIYRAMNLQMRNMDTSWQQNMEQWKEVVQGVCVFVTPQILPFATEGKELEQTAYYAPKATTGSPNVLIQGTFAWAILPDTGEHSETASAKNTNGLYYGDFITRGEHTNHYVDFWRGFRRDVSREDWYLQALQDFRLLKEYSLDEALAMQTDTWTDVKRDGGITALDTFEHLTDQYNARTIYVAQTMQTYNNRLNIGNVAKREIDTFPIGQFSCYAYGVGLQTDVKVYSEENGIVNMSSASARDWGPMYGDYRAFPAFFCYQNPNAKVVEILETSTGGGEKRYFTLKRSDYINGACYLGGNGYDWSGTSAKPDIVRRYEEQQGGKNRLIQQTNYLYTSAADNPFYFPPQGVTAIGSGEVITLETATKAMSEGTAFGTTPLYAFCTDGIWALASGTDGSLIAKQPASREVPFRRKGSVLGIDNSILFLNERGLMQIVGQNTRLLSSDLSGLANSISTERLPRYADIFRMMRPTYKVETILEADEFREFVVDYGTRLAFDYTNYCVYVFNRDNGKAFVYDLTTQMWTTCDCNFVSAVPSYPSTVMTKKTVVDAHYLNMVHEFSLDNTEAVDGGFCFWLTRPMKLGEPDTLKTIRTLMERSINSPEFTGDKEVCLWGSRDMREWHTIKDVWKGVRISGISGTPYKYFVVAGWSRLNVLNGDRISRLDVEYYDKYTDKIR